MSHSLRTVVSDSLWAALVARSLESGESVTHLVQAALADALDVDHHSIFQVSTSGAIVRGLYRGCVSVGDLRTHGDLGLGTFEGLDGEMILLDGRCYQARADGTVVEADDEALTPFATVVRFFPDSSSPLGEVPTYAAFTEALDTLRGTDNAIVAIRARGRFTSVQVRAACRTESGVDLVTATEHQSVFGLQDVDATIVGFWTPAYARTIGIGGYHLHLVTDDRRHGGHVLDLAATDAVVELHQVTDLRVAIPETEEFLRADLSGSDDEALAIAEHARRGEAAPLTRGDGV